VIIFRTDGKKTDTATLQKFSRFAPEVWKIFTVTNSTKELEKLALYIPEEYQKEYGHAFKEYTLSLEQYGPEYEEDEVRETRKATGAIRTD
jgi:hypothetical protein